MIVPRLLDRAALIAAAVAIVALAANTVRVVLERNAARAETAAVKFEFAHHREVAALAAADAERAYRRQEAQWTRQHEDARRQHEVELQAQARRVAAAAADGQRLRHQLAAFAAGGDAARDSVDACRRRAATLGQLLAEADGLAGEFAAAAEQHAGEVRLLRDAWPRPAAPEPQ